MQIDLEGIEEVCKDIWSHTTRLRELVTTVRRSDGLNLTGGQKKLLKDEFLRVKDQLQANVNELPNKVG